MADDSLAVVVTGATAVLSGLLGYGAARGQQLIERARLSTQVAEADAARAHEIRQAHKLQNEEFAARRQQLYLEYLQQLDDYLLMVTSGEANLRAYTEWWRAFQAFDNQMDLFADAAVMTANNALYEQLEAVSAELLSTDTFQADIQRLFRERRTQFEVRRAALVAAMREAVAAPTD